MDGYRIIPNGDGLHWKFERFVFLASIQHVHIDYLLFLFSCYRIAAVLRRGDQ